MSPAEVAARAESLAATVQREPAYGHTRDVVVVHNGREMLARHFGDGSADQLVDTYSMTKSVVATLVGIALEHRALTSLDEPVSRYLADARHPYTLRHLLTMTAGTEAGGAWDIDEVMARPSGWVAWILTAPSKRDPGTAFGYDNGSIHVLGAALAAAVGQPLSAYARRHLFAPLGIDAFEWPCDPDGVDYGFGHLRLRPRDIAKLGELYLGGGTFAGRRVLARPFVEAATCAQTSGGGPEGAAYGYLWWTAEEPVLHFFAAGYAGQSLTVIPDLGVVAVTVGDEARLRPGWRNARHAVLAAFAE
jgi:CubicO group peptidase (beta-lactamase class C family)